MIERILLLRSKSVPIAQIAQACGLTVGQVKYQLRKLRRHLTQANVPASPGGRRSAITASFAPERSLAERQHAETFIRLMALGPTVLFAHWNISWSRMRMVAGYLTTDERSIRMGIRLYDVTGRIFDGFNAHSHLDIHVPRGASSWHIFDVRPGRTYVADFGLFHQHRFCPILRSNPITAERNFPAPWNETRVQPASAPDAPA